MRPRHLLLPLLALALHAPAARAWTYGDTLTTIWRPLVNLPALARPGDSFTVWANAPSTATGWAARLTFGALQVPLAPAGGGWQATKGRWELQYTVPAGTPEEIYALVLTSNDTAPDTARHAVKVLPAFKSDYYFAQISDTHLPEHAFSSNGSIDAADTSGMADFDAVIEDLNVIHPEFVIHTGDLVNEGELEEYLAMYEMGRAQGMLGRLRDPVFVATGNHDIGGWGPTAPPDGTSRRNWWRYYGWPFLGNPPAGDPYHSQDFTFDYGLLHVIGLEAYINSGSYDHYQQNIWGAQSFTPEQLSWLQNDLATRPSGSHALLFYHYDFGGTVNGQPGPAFSQINPASLGLDGAIWGHNHGVAEGNRGAHPFNLGLQSVIDRRAFRMFRVHDGVMTPAPMHWSGGSASVPTDSLSQAWSGANDGTRSRLTVTLTDRFGETFEHARVLFVLADHESSFTASGGTIAQVIRQGGLADVTVDCTLPASGVAIVSVQADAPVSGVATNVPPVFGVRALAPNPLRLGDGVALVIRYALPEAADARLELFDAQGRRLARLVAGRAGAGEHTATWNGRRADGGWAPAGVAFVRLTAGARTAVRRFAIVR